MDRADYFKKKGSTVDSKFARLHRRSIDQRTVRGKSFMDNRLIGDAQFSPLKEHGAKAAMPPPRGAPPKAAKKGNASLNRSATKEPAKAAASKPAPVNPKPAAQGLSRKDKLMKWKEEKELKKRQMANSKKQQVFRVSASIDRHADTNLYVSSASNNNAKKNTSIHHVSNGAPKPAPTRVTRSSARSNSSGSKPKDTSMTRASARHVESVPCKRPRPGQASTASKPAPARPVPASRAPNTRQSARLAAKLPPPPRGKVPRSAGRGKKQVEETKEKEEELSPVEDVCHAEYPSQANHEEPTPDMTFVPKDSQGFTFTMDLPDIPFTPISPASASNFLFPSAPAQALSFTPSQRRCSTPYSLRTRKSLARTPHPAVEPTEDVLEPMQVLTENGNPETRVEEETNAETVTNKSTTKVEEESQPMQVTVETAEPEINAEEVSTVSKPVSFVMETTQAATESEPTQVDVESAEVVTKVEESVPVQDAAMETEEPAVRVEESKPEAETNTKSVEIAAEISAAPSVGEQKDVPYFKNLVASETARLLERCGVWEKIMTEHQFSDEVSGEIRSTIGKAKLLIGQRFKQFLGLIKDCEFGLGEKVTHCSDLEGFWEMVYFQVEDVDALFKELETLRDNNWQREQKPKPKVIKKKPVTKKPAGGAAVNRNAARERLMAAKAAMKAKATRKADTEKVVFEGGFFKVESPARKTIKEHCEAGSPFRASKRNTPASRTATPKYLTTPKVSKTPVSTRVQTTPLVPPSGTPTVAQLFSPISEPRRSLRTKLCGEISKLVLSDKKATPTRRTPLRLAKESAVAKATPVIPEPAQMETDKENDVDLSLYLMPVVDLNKQANDLMVTEPEDQLMQLGTPSPKKTLRPRRSSVKPKDPFSPSLNVRSQALHNATNMCSPVTRKTRKSSLGFGLSQAASLFTPTSTPEPPQVALADLISFD